MKRSRPTATDGFMREPAGPPQRLPVVRTIVEGYWWAIWHLRTYSTLALVWAIVAAVLQMLLGDLPELLAGSPEDAGAVAHYVPSLAIFAATLLGAAVIAVAAYRLVILDEPTDWRRALRLGRRELRVFGLSMLIYVVAVAEVLVLTLVLHLVGGLDTAGAESRQVNESAALIIAAVLWSLLIAVTLTPFIGLVLPLAAIDASSRLFHRSFQMSRGHRLRLACIVFVGDLLWVLASHVPWALWGSSQSDAPESLHIGLSAFITLLSTAFGAMVLGKAFAAIADRQHEGVYGVFD
jgi:hypothetical protein